MIEQFHFLRPAWLLLLLPLAAISWLLLTRRFDSASWRSVIDENLLPYVLSSGAGASAGWSRWLLLPAAVLSIVALAGPTWEKLPQPVYQQETALVIMLDLSRSMDATDIKPSRLSRARHKIIDILNARKEGQTALVVYAADAFTVTPLTTDVDTIMALLPDLETGLMPAQGTRADRALKRALELFSNSGVARGDLLLVSDGLSDLELERVGDLLQSSPGQRLSVLAIGTVDGGPIPLKNGGFLKDRDGSIVIAGLQEQNLRRLAQNGAGVYAGISADDTDIDSLADAMAANIDEREASLSDRSADLWRELGPWLLLLALPLASLAFRRGQIWLVLLSLMGLLGLPPEAKAVDWQALWRNDDQRASQLFEQGEHAAAAELFANPDWRASAKYRAGDYAGALQDWQALESIEAEYNRANALAGLGRYEEALAAYENLLQQNPAHEDASFNKQAIEDWLKQQQSQQQQGQDQQDGQNQDQQGQDQQGSQNPDQGQQSGSGDPSQQGESSSSAAESPDETDQFDDPGAAGQPAEQDPQSEAQDSPAKAESGEQDADTDDLANLEQQMSDQAAEQWLRKIPDDPGGLLRRKFIYQYRQRGGVDAEAQSW